MRNLKDIVDDAILESYLVGLTERQIWTDLEHFVKCCQRVMREHVKDRRAVCELAKKLAMAKTCALVSEPPDSGPDLFRADGSMKSPRERFVQKAARNKRMVLRALEQCDPDLVVLVEKELYRASPTGRRQNVASGANSRILSPKIAYGAMVVCLFLLVCLMVLQR